MQTPSYADCPANDLADALDQLMPGLSLVLGAAFPILVEFERSQAWRQDGAPDLETWLCTRFGLAIGTAREWARTARALQALPRCARAFAEGRLSWDQARALTRFATPEADEALAREAPGLSAAALERMARRGWAGQRGRRRPG